MGHIEKCPKCGEYSVAIDSYRGRKMCHAYKCLTPVTDDGKAFVRKGDGGRTEVVRRNKDGQEEVIETYNTG